MTNSDILPLSTEQQNRFIAQVYEIVFKRKETGSDEEVAVKIRSKVSQFFSSDYRQDSNDVTFDYDQFVCHVGDVNSRSDANFGIQFLANGTSKDGLNQVVTRTVVTDAASGKALSIVLSCWEFNDEPKLVRNRETLADPSDPSSPDYEADPCGSLVDAAEWVADVEIS